MGRKIEARVGKRATGLAFTPKSFVGPIPPTQPRRRVCLVDSESKGSSAAHPITAQLFPLFQQKASWERAGLLSSSPAQTSLPVCTPRAQPPRTSPVTSHGTPSFRAVPGLKDSRRGTEAGHLRGPSWDLSEVRASGKDEY